MAYSEKLADRVREALAYLPDVEEKKMFRGVTFMVDGKMCVSVGDNEIMCRIDPDIHEEVIEMPGCRTMVMKGHYYKGYVLIDEEGMKTKREFDFWIRLAVDFNKKAKASTKKKGI